MLGQLFKPQSRAAAVRWLQMKPWKNIETVVGPSKVAWRLDERDGVFSIRVDGRELMSSAQHGSEEALARVGLGALRPGLKSPQVLIGGLGMGFTVRAALDLLSPEAQVTVAELSGAVVSWNRGPLASLAGRPLEDPRVAVAVTDVRTLLKPSRRFDAILLDVDNGPEGLSQPANRQLYGANGVARFHSALKPGGVWVVWSAGPDAAFVARMRQGGFEVKAQSAAARSGGGRKGTRHHLFVGTRASGHR